MDETPNIPSLSVEVMVLKTYWGLHLEARLWKIASEATPLLCSLRLTPQPCEACASAMPQGLSMRLAPQILQLFWVFFLNLKFNVLGLSVFFYMANVACYVKSQKLNRTRSCFSLQAPITFNSLVSRLPHITTLHLFLFPSFKNTN